MADDQRTEQATPQRRKKAREQGSIARSSELPNVLAMTAALSVLALMLPQAAPHWSRLYRMLLDSAQQQDVTPTGPLIFWSAIEVVRWITPILLAAFAASLAASLGQGGFIMAPSALQPKISRLSPTARLSQMFSPMGLSGLLKSLLPASAIVWITAASIEAAWPLIVRSGESSPVVLASLVGSLLKGLVWKAGLVLLAWSGVDYLLTWRKLEADLRMTKQEMKEESKSSDGNPMIKRRVRLAQRMLRRKWSLQAAASATVVVTNPTHYAVALRYTPEMDAPLVVAKGLDLLAQKIKTIARENEVMLIENRPLAQALYKTVEVGDSVPAKLYQAVAEILVVVYRAQAELQRAEQARRSRDASGRVQGQGSNKGSQGARR